MANEAEARRWNDAGWTAMWREREKLTEAVSPTLLGVAGAAAGQRVCDVGCGGGLLTISLAEAVAPDGEAVGLDLSEPLLALARDRASAAGRENVRFVQTDVQTGSDEPGPFDLVVSQFGVMFFDEPTAAFAAIRSRLGGPSGGRFVFACWQDVERNPWHTRSALRALLPPPVTPPAGKSPVGPFVLGDDEYVRDLLGAAGFSEVEATNHSVSVRAPAGAVASADGSQLGLIGVAPEREAAALELVERHLARFEVGPGEYEYPLAFRVYDSRPG
jgi:SAM-dependent methyltransferase